MNMSLGIESETKTPLTGFVYELFYIVKSKLLLSLSKEEL